jgi:hypothetical protein
MGASIEWHPRQPFIAGMPFLHVCVFGRSACQPRRRKMSGAVSGHPKLTAGLTFPFF